MRVLVLSHTRCGSTTLCKWLSNELDIVLDESPYDFKTFNSMVKSNNVVAKIVVEEYYPTKEDINKFDKVICLTRENSTEASISFVQSKNVDTWHNQYEITTEWIGENKNKILEQIYKYILQTLIQYMSHNYILIGPEALYIVPDHYLK